MKIRNFIAVIAMFVPLALVQGKMIHVPADQPTIQAGIDAADEGDTVLVAPGTYVENISFNGKSITVAGRYIHTSDPVDIDNTVIDGNKSGSVVTLANGESFLSELVGFTISNGSGNRDGNGGGIYMNGSETFLHALVIRDNTASYRGGGIFYSGAHLVMNNVVVESNTATDQGGGLYAFNTNVHLEGCSFSQNEAQGNYGGGLMIYYGSATAGQLNIELNDCMFSANSSMGGGGGAYMRIGDGSTATINVNVDQCEFLGNMSGSAAGLQVRGTGMILTLSNSGIIGNQAATFSGGCTLNGIDQGKVFNCLFLDNVAAESNSGGANVAGCVVEFFNCVFVGNSASVGGGLSAFRGEAKVFNSIFRNNSPDQVGLLEWDGSGSVVDLEHCDVQGGMDAVDVSPLSTLIWGEGNIDEDPLFLGTGEEPYSLADDSPCIDAGTPDVSGLGIPGADCLGNIRVWDGNGDGSAIIDMGAYEFGSEPLGLVDPLQKAMNEPVSVYPNPFSSEVNVVFHIEKRSAVEFSVFDQMGREIYHVEDIYQAGKVKVEWNANGSPQGTYLFTLRLPGKVHAGKMFLVK